jgi:hypothetical protein
MNWPEIGREMLVTLASGWLLCGIINLCLVYVWARRSFDTRHFIYFLAAGPAFLAGVAVLMVMSLLISTLTYKSYFGVASYKEPTPPRGTPTTKMEAVAHGASAFGASPESDVINQEQNNTDNVPGENSC